MAFVALAAPSAAGEAARPYVKKGSWPETMLASREALEARGAKSSFEPFASRVLRGGREPERISVNVAGLDSIRLVATGVPVHNYGLAIWGEARLVAPDGSATVLSKLEPVSVRVGWGSFQRNKNHWNEPLKIGSRRFGDGLFAHADSEIRYRLGGKYERLEAWIGIGAKAGRNGRVRFEVLDADDAASALWERIERDFPRQAGWMKRDLAGGHLAWFRGAESTAREKRMTGRALGAVGPAARGLRKELDELSRSNAAPGDPRWLGLYEKACRLGAVLSQVKHIDLEALRLAVEDLTVAFPGRYRGYLERLREYESRLAGAGNALTKSDQTTLAEGQAPGKVRPALTGVEAAEGLVAFRREALLANPLIDFAKLLVVKRSSKKLGLPQNWQGNCAVGRTGYDNEIAVLSPVGPHGSLTTLFKPPKTEFVGDVDLDFDADKMLFSMPGSHGRWQIWEIGADGKGLRQVTPSEYNDFDNYDACYLPGGRIIFGSTSCFLGIPCVFGANRVANLCIMDADGKNLRQLCFDQDHNWCPTVLWSGRVMYLRWEYSGLPHSNSRILFSMNPDGTNQMEHYGSNSYFPNAFYFARPIPAHPTKVVGVASGHHGLSRSGRLLILDPALGRHEADGVVQEIPGRGKRVEPVVRDRLVDGVWPQFLHPYPLSDKYCIVSARPTSRSRWGIYLVDIFDNMLLLREEEGYALLEPVPLRKTPRPPVVPPRVDLSRKDAIVYLTDVYRGPGLAGIPRGTVKRLRLVEYYFGYRGVGGLLGSIGMDGPWDIKRVLGTVPVEADGSAVFRVPANTPLAVQPLDGKGQALQLMRSWFVAMPGENLSCVGCHERQNESPPSRQPRAFLRAPSEVDPWYGPTRGFSFAREVQPVLDRYCVGCHDGQKRVGKLSNGKTIPYLKGDRMLKGWSSAISGHVNARWGGKFSVAYGELHRFVRRPGIESDMNILVPMDVHASTTELMQILGKGHHGVKLDAESWERLATWIDLNAPYHGTWGEIVGRKRVDGVAKRARELRRLYASLGPIVDYEAIPDVPAKKVAPGVQRNKPKPVPPARLEPPACPGWPFDSDEAKRRQTAAGETSRRIQIAEGVELELVLIPAGEFVMGDTGGHADEGPLARVRVARPFWMGRCEITNRQFAAFDPTHDSRTEHRHGYQFGRIGYPLNRPDQPVVRVAFRRAREFCEWLGHKTGEAVRLPTEAEWEYAARAGTATSFFYGDMNADFSKFGNLGDLKLKEYAACTARGGYTRAEPIRNPNRFDDWVPKDTRFNDGGFVSVEVGRYGPNAWGLSDMHGNVWEWTRSAFGPYPYRDDDGRNDLSTAGARVVRGGSWYDRPKRCRSGVRLAYESWQPVFNVGFRVVLEARRSRTAVPPAAEAAGQLAAPVRSTGEGEAPSNAVPAR